MPSKSPAQARLMRAVAHGWRPDKIKGPPKKVAKEFVSADKDRKEKHKARSDKLNKWAHGDAKSNVGEYKT